MPETPIRLLQPWDEEGAYYDLTSLSKSKTEEQLLCLKRKEMRPRLSKERETQFMPMMLEAMMSG